MFNGLRKKIESKRESPNTFWIISVAIKDLLWRIIYNYYPLYIVFLFRVIQYRKTFKHLKTFCLFVGYPRSGHSLVGSILDAHPNMIISHELNVLEYIEKGFTKYQIYYLILNNSRQFNKIGRNHEGYNYYVPNQWHASFTKLLVLGDKKGAANSRQIKEKPWLMKKLFAINTDLDFKFVHVIRNPYDTISTIAKKENGPIDEAIDYYFYLVDSIRDMKSKPDEYNMIDIKHEDFIKNPKTEIKKLCEFLNVEPYPDYLEDCAKIVWAKPHQTRFEANWTPELIDKVRNKMKEVPFLQDYSYHT